MSYETNQMVADSIVQNVGQGEMVHTEKKDEEVVSNDFYVGRG